MKILLTVFWAFFILTFGACTTTYNGSIPNFSLEGEQAQKEFQKFRLKENVSTFTFARDPNNINYSQSSIMPLIQSVSPDAEKNIERTNKWARWQSYLLAIGLGGLVAGLVSEDDSTKDILFKISIAGSISSLGCSFYGGLISLKTPGIYNRDLKNKLNASFGVSTHF